MDENQPIAISSNLSITIGEALTQEEHFFLSEQFIKRQSQDLETELDQVDVSAELDDIKNTANKVLFT